MEIYLARHYGFCVGVKRAYDLALDARKKYPSVNIFGLLVHNSDVIKKLTQKGIRSVAQLPENAEEFLLLSAHGVPPEVYEKIKKRNLVHIDGSCPWVKRAQQTARELVNQGYHLVIVGDRNHTEVKGLLGWSYGKATVVENVAEAGGVKFHEKIGVIAQTTQDKDKFNAIADMLKSKCKELKAIDTRCRATSDMQQAAVELARKVDIVLVVGDVKSANTRRLRELCQKSGVETHQIRNGREIKPGWFKGKNKVGVTAGASTPDWVIGAVIKKLKALKKP